MKFLLSAGQEMIRDFLPMCVSYGKAEEIARVTINCSINGKGTFTLISIPCPIINLSYHGARNDKRFFAHVRFLWRSHEIARVTINCIINGKGSFTLKNSPYRKYMYEEAKIFYFLRCYSLCIFFLDNYVKNYIHNSRSYP